MSNTPLSRPLKDFLTPAIAEKAGILEINGNDAVSVSGLEFDSRSVKEGYLFFALTGLHTDGHNYIGDAVKRGASVIVYEREPDERLDGIAYLRAENSRFAMSAISDAFYDHPSRCMAIIGVTGTEGKSTTVYLIYQLLKLIGKKTGFISTVSQSDGKNEWWNSEHQTTPEAPIVHRLLADMRQNGVEFAVVESSSHGLSKKTNRLGDVDFDIAVLTNLHHEHLEFHGTWEQYRYDKAELFRALDLAVSSHRKKCPSGEKTIPCFAVSNADDKSTPYFAAATKRKTYTFSTNGAIADISLKIIESSSGGNWYEAAVASSGKTHTIRDQLPGAFNAANVLASLLVVSNLLSKDIEELVPLVQQLKPVRGRMNTINRGQNFEVLVDYAHTPSSFEAILPPLRERLDSAAAGGESGKQRRLICLFGSPGERDTQKRRLQGEIAARYSDIVVLTDEDPRGEDPMTILEEIASACGEKIRGETLFLIPDRPTAIRKAFSLAQSGDTVLLLGKGHENSIIYADKTIDYDEIAEAEKALDEL